MESFIASDSILRRIWGDADLVLALSAGASAEFSLHRSVDWLFVTGGVPRDPVGRLFGTAAYARRIAFGDRATAERALAEIRAAHAHVERRRGERIPESAHHAVLYMLADYSERAFRLLHRPLTAPERDDLWMQYRRIGVGLGIPRLPRTYTEWCRARARQLERELVLSRHTLALCAAYREHLGPWRYALLRQLQAALVPPCVSRMLGMPSSGPIRRALALYRTLTGLGLHGGVRLAVLPARYRTAVRALDRPAA
jgi:hypothetical protein